MSAQPSRLQHRVAALLSSIAIVGMACWLPAGSFSQETVDKSKPAGQEPAKSGETSGDNTRPEIKVEKKRVPPKGNPLQIHEDASGISTAAPSQLSHDFNDYRHLEDSPQKPSGKALPLFGYEMFRFARETVDAQRRYISRQSLADFDELEQQQGRTGDETTTRDSAGSSTGSETSKRTAKRKSTEDSDAAGSGRASDRTSGRRAADSNTGDEDSIDDSRGNISDTRSRRTLSRIRSQRRRSPYNDNYSDNYSGDNASDGSGNRDRGTGDREVQNAFSTPVGPISILYRGIAASVPDNYQLSSGDELKIRIESPTVEPITVKRTVDARGQIQLDNIGTIVVRGQTISSAEKMLEIRLRPYYKNVRVSIETGFLRTMSVLVTGQAYEPGTYTLPGTATAFNLLNIAGGPSDDGSLRGIEVRRRGKKVATLDIYKMITGDTGWNDVPLMAGDVIVVPPRKARVTVSGEVLRPAVYEMLPTESLRDALNYAGGIKATGLNQSVRINTVLPGSERIIKDVDVKDPVLDRPELFDGDQVEIFSVRNRLNNRVTIEGAVDQPNDYALQPGMHIADLVERAHGPLSEAYLPKAELHRWQPDNTDMLIVIDLEKALEKDPKYNLELQKWDRLKVYTREEVAWTGRRKVEVNGAVKKPGIYDVSKNMHVSDLLRMAGGPTPDAELEKAHLFHHHDDGPDSHEYVNVAAAIKGDPNKDPEVLDSDRLVLFTVEQAEFTPDHRVDIKGEVVNPGRYPRFEGMKVSDLLALAGGFRPSATNQVVLAHARRVADAANTKVVKIAFDEQHHCAAQDDVTLEDGDVVSVQGVGGFQPEVQTITVSGAVNKPGVIFLKSKNMRLSDAIREADGLRPEAFPDGAEFYRNPQMLATTGQRSLVQSLANLNDLLNDSETKRELAKAQLELIKATGSAIQDSTGLAGLAGGGAAAAAANPAASAVAGNISGSQLVSPARKLTGNQLDPNGFVAVNLSGALLHPKSADDIILVDGDQIQVPERPTTVYVLGAVNSPRGILYEPGKGLDYYLEFAGGLAPDASKDRIEIFHMGGGVIPGKRTRELKPGDYIFVPTKVLAAKIAGRQNGFESFFKSLTSSAIVFKLATGLFGL